MDHKGKYMTIKYQSKYIIRKHLFVFSARFSSSMDYGIELLGCTLAISILYAYGVKSKAVKWLVWIRVSIRNWSIDTMINKLLTFSLSLTYAHTHTHSLLLNLFYSLCVYVLILIYSISLPRSLCESFYFIHLCAHLAPFLLLSIHSLCFPLKC